MNSLSIKYAKFLGVTVYPWQCPRCISPYDKSGTDHMLTLSQDWERQIVGALKTWLHPRIGATWDEHIVFFRSINKILPHTLTFSSVVTRSICHQIRKSCKPRILVHNSILHRKRGVLSRFHWLSLQWWSTCRERYPGKYNGLIIKVIFLLKFLLPQTWNMRGLARVQRVEGFDTLRWALHELQLLLVRLV